MLGEAQKMEVGAVVQNRATGGDADRAAKIAHQVEQAGGGLEAIGRAAAAGQGHGRGGNGGRAIRGVSGIGRWPGKPQRGPSAGGYSRQPRETAMNTMPR